MLMNEICLGFASNHTVGVQSGGIGWVQKKQDSLWVDNGWFGWWVHMGLLLFSLNVCLKFSIIKQKYRAGYISVYTCYSYCWAFPFVFWSCVYQQTIHFYLCVPQGIAWLFFWKTLWITELNLFPFLVWMLKSWGRNVWPTTFISCFHSFDRAEMRPR